MDHNIISLKKQIKEYQALLLGSERKADILTNLLKEAGSEYEESLKKIQISEANFRAIFENAPEAIYIIDVSSRQILDCNPYIQKWLGYSREELLTMRVDQILTPGTENVRENIQKAVREGLVYIQERRFRKKDGNIVDAEVTGTTMDFKGKECFVALIRDVTERKKIEALRRYKELFESVSDAVFINDPKGRFLEVNDVACDCLEYTRDQFLRLRLRDVTCPDDYPVLVEMANQISIGRSYQFELSLVSRNGVVIPFEFQGRLISYQTRMAFLSVARDMSLRKNLQETLIKTERLSAVGEMASGVAHNFNNLLQMIMAGAEAATAKLKTGNILDCQEAIENIITASRRGADVVRRIKDFTHLTPAGLSEGSVFDLEALVAEAIKLTQPMWKPPSSPGKYRLNFVSKGSCYIKGKSSEIYEVLVNLIKNALEAMPDGGDLNLRTHSQDETVFLKIADTGQGISQENLQRIFVPFFTTKGTRSSGLGLSSCYGIVKKHHGEIQVESKLDQGTEFLLSFPKSHSPITVETATKGTRMNQMPIRFLLIDDEVNILKSVEMYFEDTEIDITTAKTAHDGITAIEKDRYDVILCDLSMDDMNGLEVGKWVLDFCQRQGITKTPFLLYTGLNRELNPDKLTEFGIDRVVNKPTACEDLMHIIREMVPH